MEKNSKGQAGEKRRRVKWSRVVMFLIFVGGLLAMTGWGSYHAFITGKTTYESCNAFLDNFQTRKTGEMKFQDVKFDAYTNILLLGIDDGDPENPLSGRKADTMVLISMNDHDGFIHFLSIPGDTKVSIPGRHPENKINHAYYYGGTQLAVRTVEDFLQVPIHHYIVIDIKLLIELVDILGGIDLYVGSDMDYEDPYAGLEIHLKKGYQHLDGNQTEQYVRYRSDELGDIGRVQRQQKFMKTLYDKVLRLDTLVKLPDLADVLNRRVTTSMAVLDVARLTKSLSEFQPDQMKTEMLPGDFAVSNDVTYWVPNETKIKALMAEIFKERQGDAAAAQ